MRRVTAAALAVAVLAVAEVAVLVLVIRAIGFGWTVLLLLATTAVGAWLLRREGVRGWRRFRAAADSGQPPGAAASRGLLGLLAALLLVLPGFLSDLAGLVLLLPPARAATARLVRRSAERRLSPAAAGDLFGPRRVRNTARPRAEAPGDVVEGEIVD